MWSRDFPGQVRVKLRHAVAFAAAPLEGSRDSVWRAARNLILVDEGWNTLMDVYDPVEDVQSFLAEGDDDLIPTLVEALWEALGMTYPTEYGQQRKPHQGVFEVKANEALREHRVAWELIEGRMVDFDSKELHQEVVAPVVRLLSDRAGWDAVEAAYEKALREIGSDPADAITDAGTALQEALTLLGCDGNSLGPLAKSAREKGLLAAHDATLADGIKKIVDWVSADRSEKGDAHKVARPSPDDAWLAVHVVGALILRLAHAGGRAEAAPGPPS